MKREQELKPEVWYDGNGWYWRVFGLLRHPMQRGSVVIMPGHETTLSDGRARTHRGAWRRARRAVRRWERREVPR